VARQRNNARVRASPASKRVRDRRAAKRRRGGVKIFGETTASGENDETAEKSGRRRRSEGENRRKSKDGWRRLAADSEKRRNGIWRKK